MPWADNVSGIVEAWFAGSKGADAVANILFGDVNPTAKLPMTFPRSEGSAPSDTRNATSGRRKVARRDEHRRGEANFQR